MIDNADNDSSDGDEKQDGVNDGGFEDIGEDADEADNNSDFDYDHEMRDGEGIGNNHDAEDVGIATADENEILGHRYEGNHFF